MEYYEQKQEPPCDNFFMIELRDTHIGAIILPIVATRADITVKEQFAKVELQYTFMNYAMLLPVNVYVKTIEGTYSGDLKVERIHNGTLVLVEDGYFTASPYILAAPRNILELNQAIGPNELWKVTYTFYWPISSPKGGSVCHFTLPSYVYQAALVENVYSSFKDQLSSNFKFTELNGYFLAPYEVNVKEILSTLAVKNFAITSSHKDLIKISESGQTSFDSSKFPSMSDFEFTWERVLTETTKPISIVEYSEKEQCYHLYLKAFPWNELVAKGCKDLESALSSKKTYYFTIILDTGKYVLNSENQIIARQVIKNILSKLPRKQCKLKIITPQNYYNIQFVDANEENIKSTLKQISEIVFNEDKTDLAMFFYDLSIEAKEITPDQENRIIIISDGYFRNTGCLYNELDRVTRVDDRTRLYYISVQPTIDNSFKKTFENIGSGLSVTIQDEFDLDEKIDSVLKSSLEIYNYRISVFSPECPTLFDLIANSNFRKRFRPADESIELNTQIFENSETQLPSTLTIELNLDNSEGIQVNMKTSISLEKDNKKNFFLPEIYNGILSYNCYIVNSTQSVCYFVENERMSMKCCSMNLVAEEGRAKYKFEVIYGETRQTLTFEGNSHMENVKNEIVDRLAIKNADLEKWTSGGLPIDFTKRLNEFTGDQMGCTIEISCQERALENLSLDDLHKRIVKLINANGLFGFDPKFLVDVMGVAKEDWQEFEKKFNANKEVSKMLFKIEKGINKDNRNVVFSFFCLYYINTYLSENACEVEEQLERVTKCLKSKFGYSEHTQKEFKAWVTFTPKIFS